jgi:hypothetical protein
VTCGRSVVLGFTKGRQTKQIHNTICDGRHSAQANTNNVN